MKIRMAKGYRRARRRVLLSVLWLYGLPWVQQVTHMVPGHGHCTHGCRAKMRRAAENGQGLRAWKGICGATGTVALGVMLGSGCAGNGAAPGANIYCRTVGSPVADCGPGDWVFVGKGKGGMHMPIYELRGKKPISGS